MRRRGFMFADALIGLLLLGVCAALLATALGGTNRAGRAIDAHRDALRIASETLLALQTRTVTEPPREVTITPLDTPAAKGWQWVVVGVDRDGGRAEIVGLVPGRQP
jgi:hypothetical protein